MSPQPAVEFYLVLVALLAGSFINLAADRLPRGESLVRPRSHCRRCGRKLNSIDLLPVAGYLLRGGRCATCRAPIGVGAPLIEAACGAVVAGSLAWHGLWPGAAVGAIGVGAIAAAAIGFGAVRRAEVR